VTLVNLDGNPHSEVEIILQKDLYHYGPINPSTLAFEIKSTERNLSKREITAIRGRNLRPNSEDPEPSSGGEPLEPSKSKKISLSIKTQEKFFKNQKSLIFDIGGQKQNLTLASPDDDSKLKSINDYLQFLNLVQTYETHNKHQFYESYASSYLTATKYYPNNNFYLFEENSVDPDFPAPTPASKFLPESLKIFFKAKPKH
jgi:hypothetical protein